MHEIINTYNKSGKIHHFHIVIGNKDNISDKIKDFCFNQLGVSKENFFEYTFEKLLIDDVKEILSRSILKVSGDNKKIFCIYLKNITPEAQNNFLKTVEEPYPNTFFFFISPSAKIFLPTILSRAIVIEDNKFNIDTEDTLEIQNFLHMKISEKIKFVDQIASEISNSKMPKSYAKEFVQKIILFLSKDISKDKNATFIKKLQKNQKYFDDSGSSIKILLEKVAIDLE